MEITGKIIAAMPERSGVSAKGTQWKSQDFVIETFDSYPKKCVFNVYGEDRLQRFNIQMGETLTVSFDIDAHEYNDRWFNSVRAFDVNRTATSSPQMFNTGTLQQPTASQPNLSAAVNAAAPSSDSSDDLPF